MRLVLIPLLAAVIQVQPASAEVSDEVLRRKVADLHHDWVPGNCGDSMTFLREHSDEKKVQSALLDTFYKTEDPQTKEECMVLLCHAPGFQPDEKFMQAVLKRMHHYGKPNVLRGGEAAGDAGALLIATQIQKYPDLVASEIRENFSIDDLWVQYAVIRALAKGGLLKSNENRFSESYLNTLAKHLQNDNIPGNAKTATCAFVFLGKIGEPALRNVPRSSDLQGRQLALALLSYSSAKITLPQLDHKLERFDYFDWSSSDFDLTKFSNVYVDSGPPRGDAGETSDEPSEQSPAPFPRGPLPEIRAELMISYSYNAKTALAGLRNKKPEARVTISGNEREKLGTSHALQDGGETVQLLEGSSKFAPVRFSVRLERKAGQEAKLKVSVEDSVTGKAFEDFPRVVEENVLQHMERGANHWMVVYLSTEQAQKIVPRARAWVIHDEGEARDGLQVSEYACFLIHR
jgi:hypothetical protein